MRSRIVQLAFAIVVLVGACTLEDMLPPVGPVALPFLLGAVLFFSCRMDSPAWVFAALSAGAFEESVASLPPATAIVFFAGLATTARFLREPLVLALVAYPAYQVWLGLVADGSAALGRILFAVPVGAMFLVLAFGALSWAWGKAGADA